MALPADVQAKLKAAQAMAVKLALQQPLTVAPPTQDTASLIATAQAIASKIAREAGPRLRMHLPAAWDKQDVMACRPELALAVVSGEGCMPALPTSPQELQHAPAEVQDQCRLPMCQGMLHADLALVYAFRAWHSNQRLGPSFLLADSLSAYAVAKCAEEALLAAAWPVRPAVGAHAQPQCTVDGTWQLRRRWHALRGRDGDQRLPATSPLEGKLTPSAACAIAYTCLPSAFRLGATCAVCLL